jgi:hypothetical protein
MKRLQDLIAQANGIAFSAACKLNDFFGDQVRYRVSPISEAQGTQRFFESRREN